MRSTICDCELTPAIIDRCELSICNLHTRSCRDTRTPKLEACASTSATAWDLAISRQLCLTLQTPLGLFGTGYTPAWKPDTGTGSSQAISIELTSTTCSGRRRSAAAASLSSEKSEG